MESPSDRTPPLSAVPGAQIQVRRPPPVPVAEPPGPLTRLLPVLTLVAVGGMAALYLTSGPGGTAARNPMYLVFPVLTRMKGLRGGPLDIFGMTEERRMERGLITSYEAQLDRMLSGLTPERLPLAVRIAAVPQQIRGFGHIKEASVTVAKADEAALWAEWG